MEVAAISRPCDCGVGSAWAGDYSESLPAEIGLYSDPYAVFVRLNYDALPCIVRPPGG